MLGLPEETMVSMLMKGVHTNRNSEVYMGEILDKLIPNIVEMMAANNEAILFALKDDRPS